MIGRGKGPAACYTIAAFCEAHRLSVGMYFKLKAAGIAPKEMHVGRRRLISYQAAAEWRRKREAA
jgi:hypothetical protein